MKTFLSNAFVFHSVARDQILELTLDIDIFVIWRMYKAQVRYGNIVSFTLRQMQRKINLFKNLLLKSTFGFFSVSGLL